jgi:hypothetical protein
MVEDKLEILVHRLVDEVIAERTWRWEESETRSV